jgi:hypothetical protein
VRRVAAVVLLLGVTACGGSSPPKWLQRAGHRGLRGFVQSAKPNSETYIVKRHRAFAIYDLERTVLCGGCSRPAGVASPRGDAVSLAFDTRTHRLTDMALCDVRTECPETIGFEALRR